MSLKVTRYTVEGVRTIITFPDDSTGLLCVKRMIDDFTNASLDEGYVLTSRAREGNYLFLAFTRESDGRKQSIEVSDA